MHPKSVKIISLVVVIFVSILFFVRGVIYLDPDFGWHTRMGQIIETSGIPRYDPLSYTMADFTYIDHEWLSDLLTYKIYQTFGISGLSLLFTLLAILSLTVLISSNFYWVLLLVYAAPIALSFAGIRSQLFTWLFFAVTLKFIFDKRVWEKHRLLLPAIFAVWANLHGGFLIGIIVLALFVFLESIRIRKIAWDHLVIFLLCLLGTGLNPYGIDLWKETVKESFLLSTNSFIKFGIDEWTPLYTRLSPYLLSYILVSTVLVIRYRKNFTLVSLVIYFLLLVASFFSRRHVPLWLITSLPLSARALRTFYLEKSFKVKMGLFYLIAIIAIISAVVYSKNVIYESLLFSETYHYPEQAATYLRDHPNTGNVLSSYAWAGYLEWKLPQKRVFVDGRMPTWIDNSLPQSESKWAYKDFNDLITLKLDTNSTLQKYNIDTVLWMVYNYQDIPLITDLKKSGWKVVFKNPISIIYQKPN